MRLLVQLADDQAEVIDPAAGSLYTAPVSSEVVSRPLAGPSAGKTDEPGDRRNGGTGLCRWVYTGATATEAAKQHGIELEVVKHPMAKRGFVLRPRRRVMKRTFAWTSCFRRLVRDYERLDSTLKGFQYLCFACIMLTRMFYLLNSTS
jgi:transposase